MKLIYRSLLFFILPLSLLLAGCGRVGESTVKEVLEKDPSFERMLSAKKRLDAKIELLYADFKREEDAVTQKIQSLKVELETKRERLTAKRASLRREIDPTITKLEAKLEKIRPEYQIKQSELKGSLAKLKNVEKLLEKKGELPLSGDEISIWKRRVNDLKEKVDLLRKELDMLRAKTHLLKTEIKILGE